jgi:ribonuclease P protein component
MARVGFTVSKKVGNAVQRNRARRRLRAAADALMGRFASGQTDYVIIGRVQTLDRPFEDLLKDLEKALKRVLTAPKSAPFTGKGGRRGGRQGQAQAKAKSAKSSAGSPSADATADQTPPPPPLQRTDQT